MANTTYKTLADKFFNKIKDYDLASLDEDTAYEIAMSYIPAACNMFEHCVQDLGDRDDEAQEFNIELDWRNVEILVNYMCIEFLDSHYLRTGAMLKSRLTSTDFHSLSLYNQLSKVMELRNTLKSEIDQWTINKSYLSSEMFDTVLARHS